MNEPRIEPAKPVTAKQAVLIVAIALGGILLGSLIVLKSGRRNQDRSTALGHDVPVYATNTPSASPPGGTSGR